MLHDLLLFNDSKNNGKNSIMKWLFNQEKTYK